MDEEIYVEYDNGAKNFSGYVIEVYEGYNPGVVIKNYDTEEYKHIKLNRIDYWSSVENLESLEDFEDFEDPEPIEIEDNEDLVLYVEDVLELMDEEIYVEYDNGTKSFSGTVIEVYEGYNPGVVIKNYNTEEYKHIKLNRISDWELIEDLEDFDPTEIEDEEPAEEETEDNYTPESVEPFVNCKVKVTFGEDEVEVGILTRAYDHPKQAIIISLGDKDVTYLIELDRIKTVELIESEDEIKDKEAADEEPEDNYTPESVEPFVNCEVKVTYDEDKVEVGVVTSVYKHPENPAIIINLKNEGVKHLIELDRIKVIELNDFKDTVHSKEMEEFLAELKEFIDEVTK